MSLARLLFDGATHAAHLLPLAFALHVRSGSRPAAAAARAVRRSCPQCRRPTICPRRWR